MQYAKKYTLAVVLGLVVGILTVIGQKYLPINLNFLANSGSVWLIPAFLFSYFDGYNPSPPRSCACWAASMATTSSRPS